MISYLVGNIKNIDEKSITVLTSSGVGYKVFSTLNTLLSKNIGEDIELIIHTIVKDSAIDLYGFTNRDELFVFEKLITVSGVGPRSALNILSVTSIKNIALAIENNDVGLLSGIPGVGKKSCEKIIIELKNKFSEFLQNGDKEISGNAAEESDTRLALSSLGYNEKDINNAISQAKSNETIIFKDMNTSEMIKEVLKYLR